MQVSSSSTYTFTVSSNRTLTAVFDNTTWTGDLVDGSTYRVTSLSDYTFNVYRDGNPAGYYSELGPLYTRNGTVTIIFDNDYAIRAIGTIRVEGTATLNVDVQGGDRTIKRASNYDNMFDAGQNSTMIINAAKAHRFIIDGGAVYATANDGRTAYNRSSYRGRLFYVEGGFELYNAILQNDYSHTLPGSFSFQTYHNSYTIRDAIFEDVEIRGIQAPYCLLIGGASNHNITMTRVRIYHCMQINHANDPYVDKEDAGGIIRTNGNTKAVLTLSNCEIYENRAQSLSAAIHWNATGEPGRTKLVITDGTKIHDNVSDKSGGALGLTGTAELSNCEFYNNQAGTVGGAISVTGGGGGHISYPGNGPSLTIGSGTKIYNNRAEDLGGGICFSINYQNDVGWDATGRPMSPEFRMEIQDGGWVYNNKARRGAGVAILDGAANKHRNTEQYLPDVESGGHNVPNPAYQTFSGVYRRNVVISGGSIYGNQNIGDNNNYGAGLFIQKYNNPDIANGGMGYTFASPELLDPSTSDSYAGIVNISITGGLVYNNYAKNAPGGGLYVTDDFSTLPDDHGSQCNCTVEGTARIYGNSADKNGGGICIEGGNFTMNAGAFGCEKFDFTDVTGTTHYDVSGKNISNSGNGGGFYVSGGNVLVTGGTIAYNETQASKSDNDTGNGGGFYVTGGNVEIKGGTITENTAQGNGGGFYVSTSNASDLVKINSSVAATTINANHAQNGGGTYIAQGNLEIKDSDTQITNNEATANGGGVCSMGGSITIRDNASISGNEAVSGGGIYAAADIEFTSGTIADNEATNGGGLFIPACTATLDFTSGTFSGNEATQDGGGIYISEGAVLNLQGVATITGNHVPATGHGGGIFMNGTLNVGGGTGTQSMKCNDNYAGTASTISNVYLPSNSKYVTLKSDISHQTGGVYDTQMGITVNPEITGGMRPVVYVESESNEPWLNNLMASISTTNGAVFDDTQHYIAIHTRRNVGAFSMQYIYFHDCWTTVVTSNPGTSHIELVGDVYHIKTAQGLAWFSSLVNGLNHRDGDATSNPFTTPQRNLNAVMDADVDMGANLWVPLGAITAYNSTSSTFTESSSDCYTGTFNGQGHVIAGISNGYLTGITKYGLFGATGGGSQVMNTFVDGYTNMAVNDGAYYMGGITGTAQSTIYNCEARGGMDLTACSTTSPTSHVGGIVGRATGALKMHSCMAMPEFQGTANTMGGLAGLSDGPSKQILNCYAYPKFDSNATATNVGGLVGYNHGLVENCYVRLQEGSAVPANFGWLVGTNCDAPNSSSEKGRVRYCYAPEGETNYCNSNEGTLTGNGNYAATALVNGKYGFAQCDQQVTASNDYVANGTIDNQGNLKGLLATLNNWVAAQTDGVAYSTWTRTMASPVNGDYPILEFNDFVCAGSKDNVFIAYKDDLNDMIGYANGNTAGGSVYLYKPTSTAVGTSTNANVRVYIDPNIGIAQADGNVLNARVGVALDNSSSGFMAYDWHMFSSALSNAPMGLEYHSNEGSYYVRDNYSSLLSAGGIAESVYTNTTYMDPPKTTWSTDHTGYFPTDAPYGKWRGTPDSRGSFDFYTYDEPSRHWINFKREGARAATSSTGTDFYDHWNQYVYNPDTDLHTNIHYQNETKMTVGKGYMVALSAPSMMMADGVLNNAPAAGLTYTASYNEGTGYDYPLRGVNLVGNPFQGYLDFNAFASANGIDTYYILDADAKGYIAYTTGATPQESDWPNGVKSYTADQYIHPHQGFFVRVDAAQDLRFTNGMRVAGTNATVGSNFRDWTPRYALVNMVCTDGEGRNDFATIELDRPEAGGGRKVQGLHSGDASIWFRLNEEDYQIAFAPTGTGNAPLRFEAHSDGVYTMRWNTQNGDFHYLHLIDNLTGMDIDCLREAEYAFEGRTTDYLSRFRLVFGFTGIEENEDEPDEGPVSFAFMMGNELVVNCGPSTGSGTATLQMFDINGRCLLSEKLGSQQSTLSLPTLANGVYVLRLTGNSQTRTQKMVINK